MTQAVESALADVGIVGDGPLARMTRHAAVDLGLDARLLPAGEGSPLPDLLEAFSRECQVVTFEHEQVDARVVQALEVLGRTLRPGGSALRVATDKVIQHQVLHEAGLPLPPAAVVHDVGEVTAFGREHGWPLVLKARRGGVDGRGVHVIDGEEQALFAFAVHPAPLLAQQRLELAAELTVVLARRPGGETAVYPVLRTDPVDGVCRTVVTDTALPQSVLDEAVRIAGEIAVVIDAVGILTVELFSSDGRLVVNEIACHPHLSGHLTLSGCATSQFENHLRGILDWPLGSTALRAPAVASAAVVAADAVVDPRRRLPEVLGWGDLHVHLHEPDGPRPGRAIGHVTVLGDDPTAVLDLARRAADALGGG